MKYLPLYKKWMEDGKIPNVYSSINGGSGGLCNVFPKDEFLELMRPHSYHLETAPSWGFWGCDGMDLRSATDFTTLRQNIVLFMAAMNGEL